MPPQIEIQPDVADKLLAIARTRGLSIDALLREILNQLDKDEKPANRRPSKAAAGESERNCEILY
jgi:hypothetical protein